MYLARGELKLALHAFRCMLQVLGSPGHKKKHSSAVAAKECWNTSRECCYFFLMTFFTFANLSLFTLLYVLRGRP
jgi:hypothetical protein